MSICLQVAQSLHHNLSQFGRSDVKNVLKERSTDCICPPKTPICICGHKASGKLVCRKPILPSAEEIARNERSHSAKLRIFEKF